MNKDTKHRFFFFFSFSFFSFLNIKKNNTSFHDGLQRKDYNHKQLILTEKRHAAGQFLKSLHKAVTEILIRQVLFQSSTTGVT